MELQSWEKKHHDATSKDNLKYCRITCTHHFVGFAVGVTSFTRLLRILAPREVDAVPFSLISLPLRQDLGQSRKKSGVGPWDVLGDVKQASRFWRLQTLGDFCSV